MNWTLLIYNKTTTCHNLNCEVSIIQVNHDIQINKSIPYTILAKLEWNVENFYKVNINSIMTSERLIYIPIVKGSKIHIQAYGIKNKLEKIYEFNYDEYMKPECISIPKSNIEFKQIDTIINSQKFALLLPNLIFNSRNTNLKTINSKINLNQNL
jgi:hypothetical protein